MTVAGAKALQEELDHLKKVERPQIIKAIAEAREHGDLVVEGMNGLTSLPDGFCSISIIGLILHHNRLASPRWLWGICVGKKVYLNYISNRRAI